MEVPRMRDKKEAEYLYWAGCSGAYDDRGRDISRSVAKILNYGEPVARFSTEPSEFV